MYVNFEPDDVLNQGDIISNVVLTYVPDITDPSLFIGEEEVRRDLTEPFNPDEDIIILGQALKASVIILSQGCDIDNRNFICVARILPFQDNDYSGMNREDRKAKHIRREYQQVGIRPTVFYLREAADPEFPKSLVSFLELHTIRKTPENLEYLMRNRILRLTPEAVEDLQFRVAHFFGRFAAITDDYMLTDEEKRLVRN
jgi:hypothetical protein